MAAQHQNPFTSPSSSSNNNNNNNNNGMGGSGSTGPPSLIGVTGVDVGAGLTTADNPVYNNTSPISSDASLADLYSLLIMAGALPNGIDPEDQEYMSKLTHYLMGIGGSIVCCMGTIANAMSVAVLTRPVMKSSTYMYLAALAVCDSLVLFFTLLLVLKDTKPPDSPHQLNTFHAILYPFVHPTAIVFQVTSIWLTLAFTVDRYIMICHPFQAEHMCRKSRARLVVVGIYIGGFLFNIPKYLENYTRTDEFKIANSTQVYKTYGVMTTEIGNNELFRKIVHSWGYLIFVCGIPFLTLVVLNAFLIRAVRESRLKGKEINPKEKHRNDTTVMLIGVIIIFLICQGPALVSRMTYAFKPGTTRNRAEFTLNEVASFLVILNSAINIVPYYLFGRKFRSEFWRIFCSCFLDKDEMRRIVRSYSVSMDHRRLSNYNVMEMNGMGPSKSTNEMLHASPNTVQRCGTGTTVTASLSSNLNDETSPLNHNHINNKSGIGGSCGGSSNNSGSHHLALPQIHNSHNHNVISSSSSPSHTANFDIVDSYVVLNTSDKTCDYLSGDNSSTTHPHSGDNLLSSTQPLSPSSSSSYIYPPLQSLLPATTTTTDTPPPSSTTNNYVRPSPVVEKRKTKAVVTGSGNGNVGYHGKYMSISTNAGGGGAKSNL